MKKLFSLICVLMMVFALTACDSQSAETENSSTASAASQGTEMQKPEQVPQEEIPATEESDAETETAQPAENSSSVLVAYFSATGTTKTLAGYAAQTMDADLYEIIPEVPYTSEDLDYGDSNSRSSIEQNDAGSRPAISGSAENMEQYDTIFLGYPIWWGEAPRIICTFMESYDFSGKTIVPFCTSGGSGVGTSARNLQELAGSGVTWLEGERLSSEITHEEMVNWINGLGLDVVAE